MRGSSEYEANESEKGGHGVDYQDRRQGGPGSRRK
jgi:O-acetyl-ADP-ribose deacetylase (regulator of RNase III)